MEASKSWGPQNRQQTCTAIFRRDPFAVNLTRRLGYLPGTYIDGGGVSMDKPHVMKLFGCRQVSVSCGACTYRSTFVAKLHD